jgi:hypothetical protein
MTVDRHSAPALSRGCCLIQMPPNGDPPFASFRERLIAAMTCAILPLDQGLGVCVSYIEHLAHKKKFTSSCSGRYAST